MVRHFELAGRGMHIELFFPLARHPHPQHWQDLGEARPRCPYYRRGREPQRRLCHLCAPIRPPCSPEVRCQHRRTSDCRPFHPR